MNRIILIGNGFDIANGLETHYSDFIIWLWKELNSKYNSHIENSKSEFIIENLVTYFPFTNSEPIEPIDLIPTGDYFINKTKTSQLCRIYFDNTFFKIITTNFKNKNWVDIEEDYFNALKECIKGKYVGGISKLNGDFKTIKNYLEDYLNNVQINHSNDSVNSNNLSQNFNVADFSIDGIKQLREKYYQRNEEDISKFERIEFQMKRGKSGYMRCNTEIFPENILFLNFNYTSLPTKIIQRIKENSWQLDEWANTPMEAIYIHGELKNVQNPIIFGYGDEQDEIHKEIEKRGDIYLDNIKTINYLKTANYKKLLNYLESDFYQVFIFGHSCGLSDKTLLNTIFEHENCVSIKPFFFINEKGHNNYEDIIKNIYRVFSTKSSMRDKVVPKEYCQSLI